MKLAFSLIELMVVIAIVGILATIATPSYRDYVIRSKIAATLPTAQAVAKAIEVYHQINGSFPNPLIFNGGSYGLATSTAVSWGDITHIWYNSGNDTVHFNLTTGDIGIPGWAAGPVGVNNTYTVNIGLNGGIYKIDCGIWTTEAKMLPTQYLVSGCNCTNIGIIAANITVACTEG